MSSLAFFAFLHIGEITSRTDKDSQNSLQLIIIIINIYIMQIPCEYDQMRVTNKYDTNQT